MTCQTIFLFSLLAITILHGVSAVEYVVVNRAESTPGGIKFNNKLGADYTKQVMETASNFIWNLFQQSNEADRKNVPRVTLAVLDMGPDQIAQTILNTFEIQVSDDYIDRSAGDNKWDFEGVLYHEMVHVWQWFGNAPTGLTEGIADFVRLRANYVPAHWVAPGGGTKWDQGYDVTARFLDYCDGLRNGFVAELNKKMRNGYNENYFVELLNKSADQLWSEYKAKYGN
ncbi:hypothetical protein SLA2020_246390 [Shorea laevis]